MALFTRKPTKPVDVSIPAAQRSTGAAQTAPVALPPEARIREIGLRLLEGARGQKSGLLSSKFWSDKLMNWSMKDQAFKVQLFRFVDAFPALTTPDMVHDHLADSMRQPGVTPPPGMDLGLRAGGLAKGLLASTISSQIKGMAAKFIAGTDAQSALPMLKRGWEDGVAFSVDLLGEACVSDEEADAYQRKYLDLIANLPAAVASWRASERIERDPWGVVPRVNVSIKVSSLSPRCDPLKGEVAVEDLLRRLVPILERAASSGVFINFDMEHHALKDFTLNLFERAASGAKGELGLAMQAYLVSGEADARRLGEWARASGRRVTVRLVKGAYWDYEVIHAEKEGWPCPVWRTKRETDACFERMAALLLNYAPRGASDGGVRLALGSHNVRSVASALAAAEQRGLPHGAIELQMLHGMADELKAAAVEQGLRLREYVPVGEMIPGMAYLVRRLLENTSNESWLRAGFLDNASPDALLASPHGSTTPTEPRAHVREDQAERHALSPAVPGVGDGRPFFTEPVRDFSIESARDRFARAVEGATVPRIANDSTVEQANAAVAKAEAFFPTWRDADPRERAAVLTRAAQIMRARRDTLSAVMVMESGKTWREADADVCEAIDFCEFYARCAVPLFEQRRLGRFLGELDEHWHQPRGVAAVIAPWNFPLAIACGMTVAALVTGNTVILKPAEQTPGIASLLVDALREAGTPRDALHFLPGPGETVGAALVRNPGVALIAFTGSKAVGLDILKASGEVSEGQPFVKKVVCEMGGKNAIIVDASADIDEAVLGVRQSAFGFQGQKCSACSRVIVVESAYEAFVHRLIEATRALRLGDPLDPSTDMGPVIDDAAAAKIRSYIELGRKEATLVLPSRADDASRPGLLAPPRETLERGHHAGEGLTAHSPVPERLASRLIAPHIFVNVREDSRLWREEIFGPVLCVMKARDFDHALALANASPYKLTGGVFSRKPSHLERARREFRVGNLYLNRGITGALVGRQPFGGFGMSGTGSKAGGLDYLLHFVEPRACAENTMRRGFAPEM